MKYVIESCSIAKSKKLTNYLLAVLNDGTTRVTAYIWDIHPEATPGDFKHKVLVAVLETKGDFTSCSMSKSVVVEYETLEADDILRTVKIKSGITAEMMHAKMIESMSLVTDPLFRAFFKSVRMKNLAEAYTTKPAALRVHHALMGGLAEHVYEMLDMYIALSKTKPFIGLRHELCIAGIMFHDYGKMEEYDTETWEATEAMFLLGHIYISAQYLQALIRTFNKEREDQGLDSISHRDMTLFVHMILAHHRQKEWGSPVNPSVKEAMMVHFIDEMSGKGNQFDNANNLEKAFFLSTNVVKSTL